jgi:hypothetical protein
MGFTSELVKANYRQIKTTPFSPIYQSASENRTKTSVKDRLTSNLEFRRSPVRTDVRTDSD